MEQTNQLPVGKKKGERVGDSGEERGGKSVGDSEEERGERVGDSGEERGGRV